MKPCITEINCIRWNWNKLPLTPFVSVHRYKDCVMGLSFVESVAVRIDSRLQPSPLAILRGARFSILGLFFPFTILLQSSIEGQGCLQSERVNRDSYFCDIWVQRNTKLRRLKMSPKTTLQPWSSQTAAHTKKSQNDSYCCNQFNSNAYVQTYSHYHQLHHCLLSIRQAPKYTFKCLIWLDRLGQANGLILRIEDDVELPDEDISQDPELLGATLAKASAAAVGALRKDDRKYVYFPQIFRFSAGNVLLQWAAGVELTCET